ncbi:hypothetical protein QQF64_012876 [Cirrhinus molitorella]|uniref:MADF domain-containing protein n=1 Tax=Cirrhinus molitorella TaxID=172907 RepID=A0ABR3LR67_9TELE
MSKNISDSTETRDDGTQTKAPMKWTEKHDVLLCKQILCEEPHKYKKSSVNRGKAWSTIADTLNYSQDLTFKVTQRSVRERFTLLQEKYRDRNKNGGTSAETTELDDLIEEITEREDIEKKSETDSDLKIELKRMQVEQAKTAQQTQNQLSEMIQLFKQQQEQWQAMQTVILQQHQEQGQALLSLVESMTQIQ